MVLGVDVGGTKVAVAAVDGVTATRTREHPTVTVSADALLDGVEHVVRDVIADAGQPEAIGVGVPSQIEFATGTVETSVNIPLTGVPLREELGRRFGVPVLRGQRRELRRARRGAHRRREPSRDAHARDRGRRGRGDRRHDLPRRSRTRRRAGPHRRELGRPAVPGQLPEPRLPRGLLLRPGARARRHRARQRQARQPPRRAARAGRQGCRRARLVAAADDGDGDALLHHGATSGACSASASRTT